MITDETRQRIDREAKEYASRYHWYCEKLKYIAAENAYTAAATLYADREEAKDRKIENLKSVMIAAAEKIQEHWQAHCDKEGYGPANLMHRLEKGIPAQYGYTGGAFTKLQADLTALRECAEEMANAIHAYEMAHSKDDERKANQYLKESHIRFRELTKQEKK